MASGFTPEEQEVLERLRNKYATGAHGVPLDPNNIQPSSDLQVQSPRLADSAGPTRKSANVDVRMCAICHGMGVQIETYNHRRLEKVCTACEGQGVCVYRDGKVVAAQPALTRVHNADDDGKTDEDEQGSSIGDSASSTSSLEDGAKARHIVMAERVTKLHTDLEQISARVNAYEKEKASIASAGAGGDSAQAIGARNELLKQLDAQLGRLQVVAARKRVLLSRLAGTEEVTIETIIANAI